MSKCGICNKEIDPDENWTETDCVICECCSMVGKRIGKYIPNKKEVDGE